MKRMKRYFKGLVGQTVLAPLFKLLEALFELLVPFVVAWLVDTAIPKDDTKGIIYAAIILVLMGILGFTSSFVAQYFSAKVATRVASRMKIDLYKHISSLSMSELDAIGVNTLETRLTSDMNQVQTGVNMTLRLLLRSPFVVFGALIFAFVIDVKMAFIFLVIIILEALVVSLVMSRTLPQYKKTQEKLDGVMASARENLSGMRLIRAFGKEDAEEKEFKARNVSLKKTQIRVGRISAVLNPLTYALINLALVLLVYVGALRVNAGTLSTGQVIALYDLLSQILIELIKLANLIITMTRAVACANRVEECFKVVNLESKGTRKLDSGDSGLSISFENVSFRYQGSSADALAGVSFRAHPGDVIGIIGGTGSGKSTLISLIPRYYEATSGIIRINNEKIEEYDEASLRSAVGIVFQKAVLFRGTIRDNLKLGAPLATDEELVSALKVAQAWDFVKEKSGGLDSFVDEGGQNFSGGQRQRLTIARALVRHPRLLILDDAASALDLLTERALREGLSSLPIQPTTIIVSQRTSSLRHASLILVLSNGEIVGRGTHEELLEKCPLYREIHASQFPEEVQL